MDDRTGQDGAFEFEGSQTIRSSPRLGYQMARSPVLPIFAADLGALPELIGVIVAASTITGVFFKLPSGALSDVLGRKRMMVLGALFFRRAAVCLSIRL